MFKWFSSRKPRGQGDAVQAAELRDDEVEKARGGIIAVLIGLAKPKEPERPAEFHSNHTGGVQ